MLLLASVLVVAHGHEAELEEGRQLVASGARCDALTEDQLEAIGEYLMEQMHPGAAHDAMHQMMGIQEGTPQHGAFHINIAQMMYCIQPSGMMMGPGMMYGGMMGGPMMRGGMMGMPMMGHSMMGWGYKTTLFTIVGVLWLIILLGLAIAVWLWVIKLYRDVFSKKR